MLTKGHPEVKTTEGRPRQYYFTQSTDSAEIDEIENITTSKTDDNVKEHDLYPLLSKFLWSELEVYSKRINEKHSRNKHGSGGNKWLYPDVVGIQDLSNKEWHREIKDCVLQYFDKKTKL